MADPIIAEIFKNIETTLAGVDSLATVVLGRPEHMNFPRPICGVFPVIDVPEWGAYSISRGDLAIKLRVLVDEELDHPLYELFRVVADIMAAMHASFERGGWAANTIQEAVDYLYVDAELPRAGADINYKIDYRTTIEDARVKVG